MGLSLHKSLNTLFDGDQNHVWTNDWCACSCLKEAGSTLFKTYKWKYTRQCGGRFFGRNGTKNPTEYGTQGACGAFSTVHLHSCESCGMKRMMISDL